MLLLTLVTALVNLVVLGAIPFGGYFLVQKWRRKRTVKDIFERAGLRLGEPRYLRHALLFALLTVATLLLWQPPVEVLGGEGSAQSGFYGLDLASAIPAALIYGCVTTGFTEELLFRGLIAGSFARKLSFAWANTVQATIFLLPHLMILVVMPEVWEILPLVFAGALVLGWIRIRSGSILGPWLIHSAANVTTSLYVAVSSSP